MGYVRQQNRSECLLLMQHSSTPTRHVGCMSILIFAYGELCPGLFASKLPVHHTWQCRTDQLGDNPLPVYLPSKELTSKRTSEGME